MSLDLDRFTDRARKALALAEDEARRLWHGYLGTEHLLVGIAAERQGVARRLLAGVGVDLARVREAVLLIIGRGAAPADAAPVLPPTPRLRRAVEVARAEAARHGHDYVGTEHLLLGLLHRDDSDGGPPVSIAILEHLGIDLDRLRRQTLDAIGSAAGLARTRDNVITCRVDDQTLAALDALVEAGVHATRSEAAARLMHAGMEANRELLAKVFVGVAEIRRVREETQRLAQGWAEAAPAGPAAPPGIAPEPEPTTARDERRRREQPAEVVVDLAGGRLPAPAPAGRPAGDAPPGRHRPDPA